MNAKTWIICCLLTGTVWQATGQDADNEIRKGNGLYRNGQYPDAEGAYRQALALQPGDKTAEFNLANSLFRQQKNEDAAKMFDALAASDAAAGTRSGAAYNKGVMLTNEKRLEESIEAYKQALRLNPDDKEARDNLQKALMELKKKEQPKKKDEKKKNDKKEQEKPRPKMNRREAEKQLELLNQKEKEVQERLQKNSNRTGNVLPKDW